MCVPSAFSVLPLCRMYASCGGSPWSLWGFLYTEPYHLETRRLWLLPPLFLSIHLLLSYLGSYDFKQCIEQERMGILSLLLILVKGLWFFSPSFLNVQLCMNPKTGHVCWEPAVPLRVLDSRCLPHAHKEMCFVERYSQCCPLIWEGTQFQCLWNSPMSKLHYFVKGKSYWKFSKAWQWMTAT